MGLGAGDHVFLQDGPVDRFRPARGFLPREFGGFEVTGFDLLAAEVGVVEKQTDGAGDGGSVTRVAGDGGVAAVLDRRTAGTHNGTAARHGLKRG